MDRSAQYTTGVLIKNIDGSFYFRVYAEDKSFVDYDILHCDLTIQIMDSDAYFKDEDTDNPVIDYSNQTLGR